MATNQRAPQSIADLLRDAIDESGETIYRIAKDAEVDWGTLQRFVDGRRPNIRIDTIEKLCDYLGLELRPMKRAAKRK